VPVPRETLERPRLRDADRRGDRNGKVHSHERVSELARAAGPTAVDSTTEHESTADPCADGDHHEVVRHQPEPIVMGLRERRHRRVIVDVYRRTEPLRQQVAERQVPQRR
jgi:hypothetical protein